MFIIRMPEISLKYNLPKTKYKIKMKKKIHLMRTINPLSLFLARVTGMNIM